MSRKVFTAGEVLAAADVNSFLMDQTVMSFAGTAARGSAIPSPVTGMTTYLEDSKDLQIYNGTSYASPFGLTLIKKQTIGTGVSSVTVSDAFSSTYDNYKVLISGGVASLSNALYLRLGTTNTGYKWGQVDRVYSDGSLSGASSSNDSQMPFGIQNTSRLYAELELSSPFQTTTTFLRAGLISTASAGFWAGTLDNTTSYTSFLVQAGSGTLTGGTICVYGYRKD